MGVRVFATTMVIFALTSCATMDHSDECDQNRRGYAAHGLNIEWFREGDASPVTPDSGNEEIEVEIKKTNPGADIAQIEMGGEWQTFLLSFRVLRQNAVKYCGEKNDNSKHLVVENHQVCCPEQALEHFPNDYKILKAANVLARGIKDKSLMEPLSLFIQHESQEYHIDIMDGKNVEALIKKIQEANAVDISKPWRREDLFTYPLQKGQLKEDAKSVRKGFLQQWVFQEYNDLAYIAFFNRQFQKLLSEKLPLRLSNHAAWNVCEGLATQLDNKFGINQEGGEESTSTNWQAHVDSCQSEIGLELDHDDDIEYLRNMLSDKYLRAKLTDDLLSTVLTVDASRISDTQIKLIVSIDFPKFFQNYKFRNVADLTEK